MSFALRVADWHDIPALEALIPLSVRELQAAYYSPPQIEGALGTVFAVDRQLISDGTYFVVDDGSVIVGCGGWSKRKTLFGGDQGRHASEDGSDQVTVATGWYHVPSRKSDMRLGRVSSCPDRARRPLAADRQRA